jgi:hypothetical protein
MHHGAVAARALAEHAPEAVAAAAETLLDEGKHLADQEGLPGTHGGAVDILVATKPREAVGESHDNRRHGTRADETIEALRHILAVVLPIGVGGAAGRVADEVNEKGKAAAVMTCGHIDIHPPPGRIAEQVVLQALAVDPEAVHRTCRNVMVLAHHYPSSGQSPKM